MRRGGGGLSLLLACCLHVVLLACQHTVQLLPSLASSSFQPTTTCLTACGPLPTRPTHPHLPRSTIGQLDHDRQSLQQRLEQQQAANAGLRAAAREAKALRQRAHAQCMGLLEVQRALQAQNRALQEELRTQRWRVKALLLGGAVGLALAAGCWALNGWWQPAMGSGGSAGASNSSSSSGGGGGSGGGGHGSGGSRVMAGGVIHR